MNRCILAIITAFILTSTFAQSDFIQLKKKDKVIQTWFKGNYIYTQLKNGQWINAVIYNIKDDSLYLRPYIVQTFINRLGFNFLDTTFYGLMAINANYLHAFPKKDEGFSYPADKPIKRIDHIFYRDGFKAKKASTVQTLASDHVPVVAELQLILP